MFKNIILLLIVALHVAHTQNYEPRQRTFDILGSTDYYIDTDTSNYFHLDNQFLWGWQWSMDKTLSRALKMNFGLSKTKYVDILGGFAADGDFSQRFSPNIIYDSSVTLKRFNIMAHIGHLGGINYYNFTNLQSIQWEPTLIENESFNNFPRVFDKTNPIFSFKNFKGEIINSYSYKNDYSRLLLSKDSTSHLGLVLSGNSFNNHFYYEENVEDVLTSQSEHINGISKDYLNGVNWLFSLNLRRTDSLSTLKDTASILNLRIKWISFEVNGQRDSGYVKFRDIPSLTANDTTHISWEDNDNRGILQNTSFSPGSDNFTISRNVLPTFSDNMGPDITIRSLFICNGTDTVINNPMLDNGSSLYKNIEFLNIEVSYLGNESIGIDWIKIEQPAAAMLYDGMIDDAVVSHLEKFWQQVAVDSFMNKGIYFPRIHDRHEYPTIAHFGPVRYFNKLLGGIVVSETDVFNEEKYHHYLGSKSRWPITWGTTSLWSVPYFRSGDPYPYPSNAQLLRLKYGNTPPDDVTTWGNQDTLKSAWETFTVSPYGFTTVPNLSYLDSLYKYDIDQFWVYIKASDSYLANKEQHHYKVFHDHNYMFFSKKPLWTQTQVYSHFGSESTSPYNIYFLYGNPLTKEFLNHSLWWNLLHGSKGQLFDGSYSSKFVNGAVGGSSQLMSKLYHNQQFLNDNNLDTMTSWELIERVDIGSDFVAENSSDWTQIDQKLNYNDLEQYYGMNEDRFYLGRKTHRVELLKMISFIDEVENTLLDLNPQAYFWSGFATWEAQHPINFQYWDEFVIGDYIDLTNIRTRKLFQPNEDLNHNLEPELEHKDSSFYDLSFLTHKDQKITSNRYNDFYLGLLNRRTDPLIFNSHIATQTGDTIREMQFYSGSEFDDFSRDVNNNNDLFGISRDSTWWQDQWWKRLGSREIQIPFDVAPFGNGYLLDIEELNVHNLDDIGWWYNDKYYHKIDTIIPRNGKLIAKLLPGQGKFIKVSFLEVFEEDCNVCDQFNDFDKFSLSLASDPLNSCCFDIKLIYNNLECDLDDISFRLIVKGTNDPDLEFEGSQFNDSIQSGEYFKDVDLSINSLSTEKTLGKLCIPDNGESYTVEFLIGKESHNTFAACDRKSKFKLKCDNEAEDCCDSIELSSNYYEVSSNGNDLIGCCTEFYLKQFNSKECIYSVDFTIGNKVRKNLVDSLNPLNYNITDSLYIGSWCMPAPICAHEGQGNPEPITLPGNIEFKDQDGTILCSKPMDVKVCCIWTIEEFFDLDEDDLILDKAIMEQKAYEYMNDNQNIIYPNPNSGEFTLSFNSENEFAGRMFIMDLNGRTFELFHNYNFRKGNNLVKINLNTHSNGTYFLVISGDDYLKTIPFIIE